ncbi:hypothetical protein [Bradyrhizobium sp. CB3481]|uniref:hypothetical protein n=1 Tax=Bradyrhizobium sp. CB3481 TaxID=3039158 RepID=UPI0024B1731E|nr:hypothetical protein [Bradyrhizobium sp. CB3481]WFU14732.1 hypothetical protein QA643_27155 [Bradyrhizobium sp. CB3481]
MQVVCRCVRYASLAETMRKNAQARGNPQRPMSETRHASQSQQARLEKMSVFNRVSAGMQLANSNATDVGKASVSYD